MSDLLLNLGSFLDLMLAVWLIWLSSQAMVEKKVIIPFVPFFMIGLAYCFTSVFSFYFLLTNIFWFFKNLFLLISFGLFVFTIKKYVSD
ncbi:MAG: hypothetical protein PHP97_01515 [Candidatus Shapirobacteria bacterium]|nr:hypothetical protein [Candidatus Shapirobacteria bacterium]MDD3002862.1 hypothetical protein [Candidatus Shapirobacteria bacterium]MDD4382936.1 hypothetical protein [Candidatus Shapirobacteria bacterium]